MNHHQWLLAALACAALVIGCTYGVEPVPSGQHDGGTSFPQLDGPVGQWDGPQNPAQHDGPQNPAQHDGGTSSAKAPGGACQCDNECQAVGAHAGICVFGVCMTKASTSCSAAGSTAECGAGSRCWGLQGYTGAICWPDCATYTSCAGTCDADGSCVSTTSMDCDNACGSYCSAPVDPVDPVDPGPGPGPAPNPLPSCLSSLPARDCTGGTSYCSQLVTFDPRTNTSWDDYPINGETSGNQYRSYLRRDLAMLIQYATAKVACLAGSWTSGVGGPLGLGDMSESNGAIPGTSVGSAGHPAGTHTNGPDIDVGYYQTTGDNKLREICAHTTSGTEQYHCTAAPTTLDKWRHALFLGILAESSRLRVIGVDGQAGALLEAAIAQLCTDGWMSGASCNDVPLAYEVTNQGYGWYLFHHHHSHVSVVSTAYSKVPRPTRCLDSACTVGSRKALPMQPHVVGESGY